MDMHVTALICLCRMELQIFKARFVNWDDVLAVDFTRTPEMLEQRKKEMVSDAMKQSWSLGCSSKCMCIRECV